MLRDGLSNDELVTLLAVVDRRGVPLCSDAQIASWIDAYKTSGKFGFTMGLEEGFDAQKALQDLQQAQKQRAQGSGDLPAKLAAHVAWLSEASTQGRDIGMILNQAQAIIKSGKSGASPTLSEDAVRDVTCQYVEEVGGVPLAGLCQVASSAREKAGR